MEIIAPTLNHYLQYGKRDSEKNLRIPKLQAVGACHVVLDA
jgi:hypothetical protein